MTRAEAKAPKPRLQSQLLGSVLFFDWSEQEPLNQFSTGTAPKNGGSGPQFKMPGRFFEMPFSTLPLTSRSLFRGMAMLLFSLARNVKAFLRRKGTANRKSNAVISNLRVRNCGSIWIFCGPEPTGTTFHLKLRYRERLFRGAELDPNQDRLTQTMLSPVLDSKNRAGSRGGQSGLVGALVRIKQRTEECSRRVRRRNRLLDLARPDHLFND